MSGFADVYQRLCERYPDEHARGRAFEPIVKRVLSTDPMYRERFAQVWQWNEWPGRDGVDIGIDLVAERHDGGFVAIQCKCQDRIEKGNIDSFLADSQRRLLGEPYVERYIFTTATRWSDNAERALTRIAPPVQRVDFFGLEGAAIDWDAYLRDESAPLQGKPRKQLRPHQVKAVDDVRAGFEASDRGKLIMAVRYWQDPYRIAHRRTSCGPWAGACCSRPPRSPCSHSRCGNGEQMLRYLYAHSRFVRMRRLEETTLTAPAPTTCRFQPRLTRLP